MWCTAGEYFTTRGPCGSPWRMPSTVSLSVTGSCALQFTMTRAGNPISGGSSRKSTTRCRVSCARRFAFMVSALARIAAIIKYTLKLKPMVAIAPLFRDRRDRGMSAKYDELDWIGGFPFEFAGFDVLAAYFAARGFTVINSKRNNSWGCNELALRRTPCAE